MHIYLPENGLILMNFSRLIRKCYFHKIKDLGDDKLFPSKLARVICALAGRSLYLIQKVTCRKKKKHCSEELRSIISAFTQENQQFAYAKAKANISCVTAQLISAYVFAIRIVLFLFCVYPMFQASNFMLSLYSLVLMDLVGNPNCCFSLCGSSYVILQC